MSVKNTFRIHQSETYSLWDTIFYDNATSSNYNPNWKLGSSPVIDRDENGTTLSSPDTAWRNMTVSTNGVDNLHFSNPVCIEFDVVSLTNTCRMEIYYSTDYRFLSTFANYGVGHYRVEYTITQQKVYVDDVLKQTVNTNFTGRNPRLTLVVWNEGALKFKNLKIYPI